MRSLVLAALLACPAALAACGDEDRPNATATGTIGRVQGTGSNGEELEHDADRAAEGVAGKSVCRLLPAARVEQALARNGLDVRQLAPERNDSLDLSICRYARGAINVRILLDGAADATRRYYNQLSEAQQKFNPIPSLRPRTVRHVGDDSTYGGAGAYWTRGRDQLVAFKDDRILRVTVHVPGEPDARRKAAAASLARKVFAQLPRERQQ